MSTPSPVEAIFFAALEKEEGQRAAYLDEACRDDPDLRRRVERLLEAHPKLGSFLEKPATGPEAERTQPTSAPAEAGVPPSPEGSDATRAEAPGDDRPSLDFLEPSTRPGSLGRLGHYEVLELVGVGGMGAVYRAFDEKLHRVVAIKLMASELAASATARRRFTREAQAAAAVCHEHVVTIHAVEEDHSPPYLVMQYVEGVSLQDKLDRTGPLGLKEVLRIGLQTAEGLAAAHKQGLVHRDVKPANILLENGVERVKITDFGLARAADDASLTQSGVIAGTPQYMSPEQAEGRPVDPRSDLFSLGSVLYACCTGRPPFRASTTLAVLKRVAEDTPRLIREINPDVPDWLIAVIDRLHAKDPARRFQTAAEVADVLGRHLSGLQQSAPPAPVPARPAPRRRRRAWVAAAAVLLLLAAGLGVTEAGGVTQVVATVIRIVRPDGTLVIEADDPDLQVAVDGEEIALRGAGLREIRLRPGTHEVQATRDGQTVQDQTISVSRGGKSVVRIHHLPAEAPAPAAPAEPPIRGPRLNVPTHPEATLPTHIQALLQVHPGPAVTNYVAFTPDGRTLVVANEDGTIQLWDPATGQEIRKWQGPTLKVMDLAVSADGQRAATASGFWDKPDRGGDVQVWDLASGKLLAAHHEPGTALLAVAFAPDGRTLAVGGFNGAVRLVDTATGEVLKTLQQPGQGGINGLAFTSDGKTLAGGGARPGGDKDAGLVRLWDVATGTARDVWRGEMGEVQCLRFSPDGGTLAAGCRDHTIHLWDVAGGRDRAVLDGHTGIVHSLAFFHGDGSVLVSGGLEGTVKLWNAGAGREMGTLTTGMEVVLSVALSPDGRSLAVGGGGPHEPGWVELWDLSKLWPQRGPRGDGAQAAAPAHPAAEPFVILARNGKAERRFASLAGAVGGAVGGDTIEVRGDGPFVTPPLFLKDVPLTVRAGVGFRPVLQLSADGVRANQSLLTTDSALVLEGLELWRTGQAAEDPGKLVPAPVVRSAEGALYAANCRFVMKDTGLAIVSHRAPTLQVRNCEFLNGGTWFAQVEWGFPDRGRLLMDNCVLLGGGYGLGLRYAAPAARGASARMTRTTVVAPRAIVVQLNLPAVPDAPHAPPGGKPVAVEARANLFDTSGPTPGPVVELVQTQDSLRESKALSLAAAESLLPRLLGWQGQQNLYPAHGTLLGVAVDWQPQAATRGKGLDDWRQFWGSREEGSVTGQARYHGGDAATGARLVPPGQFSPADVRLRPDSPGHAGADHDSDVGADVNLVGPGPAYERWRQTPEYRQWLEDAAEARAGR